MNDKIKKRIYSLFWRASMMAIAVVIDGLIKMVSNNEFNLNPIMITLLGLVLGEVSKYFNNISLKEI